MIEQRQLEYMQLGSRAAKTAYAMQLVLQLRKKGIRFLKRDPNKVKIWKDVGDTKMREKVSQNLREHQPELKKQLAEEMVQQRVQEENLAIEEQPGVEGQAERAESPDWGVQRQYELRKPYATLPPPPVGFTEYYGLQPTDEASQYPMGIHNDESHQRPLIQLDGPLCFHNQAIETEIPPNMERLPAPDLESSLLLGDIDPIPFDEAVGAVTDEDLWSPCTLEALRKRSFVEYDDDVEKRAEGSDKQRKRSRHAAGEYDQAGAQQTYGSSLYTSFEPRRANEVQELLNPPGPLEPPFAEEASREPLFERIELAVTDHESILEFPFLESFSDSERFRKGECGDAS